MRVNSQERTVAFGGVTPQAFKVEMNGMLFHSVIDGIYADKISSPFRELCTNARDGHAANGNLDEPFDVFLPSALNPVFKVRDYGIGLSHDDIMGLYTTMFASSKRDSNDAVGMIGLGSKSPFAYTGSFTVTSYFDGEARTYSAFIGETGVPQIALMNAVASNQRGGIEVQFPVKQEDIQKFRNAAPRVLFGFSPYPNIQNEAYVKPKHEILYSGANWTMYAEAGLPFSSLMARQGCVLYPIDTKPLGVTLSASPYGNRVRTIYEWPIVIDFPIGELDVSTSREALGYTHKTIENLKTRIDQTMQEMTALIDKEIREAPTYLDACSMAVTAKNDSSNRARKDLFNTLFPNLRWNGKALIQNVSGTCANTSAPFHWFDTQYVKAGFFGSYHPTIGFRPSKLKTLHWPISKMKTSKIYVEFEGLANGPARMRRVINDTKLPTEVLWIRPTNRAALDTQLEAWGNPEWIDLSTIEPVFAPKSEKKETPLVRLRYHQATTQYAYVEAKYEYVTPTADMYYIKQTTGLFYIGSPNDPPLNITGCLEHLRLATTAGLLPAGQKIYFLNSQNIKILEKVKMKPIGELIFENAKEDFSLLINQTDATNKNHRTKVAQDLLQTGMKMPADLSTYLTKAAGQAAVTVVDQHVHRAIRLFCPQELEAALRQTDTLKDEWEQLRNKYPLLLDVYRDQIKLSHYLELISK